MVKKFFPSWLRRLFSILFLEASYNWICNFLEVSFLYVWCRGQVSSFFSHMDIQLYQCYLLKKSSFFTALKCQLCYRSNVCVCVYCWPQYCLIFYTLPSNDTSESGSVLSESLQPMYTGYGILQARAGPGSLSLLHGIQSRDRTQVSHIAVWFFTSLAIREALHDTKLS